MLDNALAEVHPPLCGICGARKHGCFQQHSTDGSLNVAPELDLVCQKLRDQAAVQWKLLKLLLLQV